MGIKAKILKELQKKPRRLKELKAKLGNDKKVARAVDELVERNKVVCRKGVYAVPDPKTAVPIVLGSPRACSEVITALTEQVRTGKLTHDPRHDRTRRALADLIRTVHIRE